MEVVELQADEGRKVYLLLDDEGKPIYPVAKYMKSLFKQEKSSNTLKTYCQALKRYFEYLQDIEKKYTEVNFDLLSDFVAWLRNPYESNKVVPQKEMPSKRTEKTVNLYITVITSFYDYLYRAEILDEDVGNKLFKKMFVGVGGLGYKSFMHHIDKGKPRVRNVLKLKEPKEKVKILTTEQVNELYHATTNIRDKFLIHLLFETGLRIGEVLSLFLEDFKIDKIKRDYKIQLTDRGELPNGGKLKTGERTLNVSQGLINFFNDYLYEMEIGFEPDHNFVFIKWRGENEGEPLTYSDVYATFKELERKTGIHVTPHLFRHTHGTIYYLQTKNIKAVQERLGHAQVQTTMNLYVHLSDEEIRKEWEKAQSSFQIGQGRETFEVKNLSDKEIPF